MDSCHEEIGKYGNVFMLTVSGAEKLEELTFFLKVVSDTGVQFVSPGVK